MAQASAENLVQTGPAESKVCAQRHKMSFRKNEFAALASLPKGKKTEPSFRSPFREIGESPGERKLMLSL